jgi:acyl carrier protein
MDDFLKDLATILEVEQVNPGDDLKAFPSWDSLAVLSVIAMLDSNYGVLLRAADFAPITSAADLWKLVQSKKA